MLLELWDTHGILVDHENFETVELQGAHSQFICHTQLLCNPVHCLLNFFRLFESSNSINLVNNIGIDIHEKLHS
jgi:hypothetical protein